MEPTTTDILTDALKRAAAAHGVYEEKELMGKYDDDWPRWYAEHMTRTLTEDGYLLVPGTAVSHENRSPHSATGHRAPAAVKLAPNAIQSPR